MFDGGSERFERHRCGGSRSFRIGDRADWSYLLPKRLPKGRYTIRVVAIDNAGNELGDRDGDPGPVKRALALVLAGAALAAPAAAEARGRVDVMVVGRTSVLVPAERVTLKPRTAAVAGRRCSIGSNTPLSALAGTGVSFRLHDYGACSRRARDAGSLYVRRIGSERARGADGWVYKVGRRSGSSGAADPARAVRHRAAASAPGSRCSGSGASRTPRTRASARWRRPRPPPSPRARRSR